MTTLPSRTTPGLLAAVAAVAASSLPAAGLAAQEPSDTAGAGPDSAAVVVPPSGSEELQARLDSARRMERARRNAVVRSLRPGDRLRVTAQGRTFDGRYLRMARGHLFLRRDGDAGGAGGEGDAEGRAPAPAPDVPPPPEDPSAGPGVRQIPVDAMEALWIRLGRTGSGALWGGILGAVGGAVGGYLINDALCNDAEDCIFDGTDAAVAFGIGGGLVGTGIGAFVGRNLKEWRRWFPEEEAGEGGAGI